MSIYNELLKKEKGKNMFGIKVEELEALYKSSKTCIIRPAMAMDGMLEKIQERKKKERRENVIARCHYWGTYSRIVSFPEDNELGKFVEVTLTPVNGRFKTFVANASNGVNYQQKIWTDRSEHNVPGRLYISDGYSGAIAGKPDFTMMKSLPEKIREMMLDWLDEETVNYLLSFDFPNINFKKLAKHNPHGRGWFYDEVRQ